MTRSDRASSCLFSATVSSRARIIHSATAVAAMSLLIVVQQAPADQAAITMDGCFDDWADVSQAWFDPSGDHAVVVDFGSIQIANDDRDLYFRIDFGFEIPLQDDSQPPLFDVVMYVDIDDDPGTGLAVHDIGADFAWSFRNKNGVLNFNGVVLTLSHASLDFVAQPTVTSNVFEMAFELGSAPWVFQPGDTFRVVFIDEINEAGDHLPDAGSIAYTIQTGDIPPDAPRPTERLCSDDLRLLSYNVRTDGPWVMSHAERFQRVVGAIAPDVINFQEISAHTTDETIELVESWFPDTTWFGAGHSDCKTISRYPILGSAAVQGNLAVHLDLTQSAIGSEMLIVNAHLPCCANEADRRAEIDSILTFIRSAVEGTGPIVIQPETPVLVTGDLNLVGLAETHQALLHGHLLDGTTFPPDWDGSSFGDAVSLQTERRRAITWRSGGENFWPGRLDFTLFTDSVLSLGNCFTIETFDMSPEQLDLHGLLPDDSNGSDHLPLVTDFRLASPPADLNDDSDVNVLDLLLLLGAWGACPPAEECVADLNGDDMVTVLDLLMVLSYCGGE